MGSVYAVLIPRGGVVCCREFASAVPPILERHGAAAAKSAAFFGQRTLYDGTAGTSTWKQTSKLQNTIGYRKSTGG